MYSFFCLCSFLSMFHYKNATIRWKGTSMGIRGGLTLVIKCLMDYESNYGLLDMHIEA